MPQGFDAFVGIANGNTIFLRNTEAAVPCRAVERALALGTDAGRRGVVAARIRDGAAALFVRRVAVEQLERFFEKAMGWAQSGWLTASRPPGPS